MKPHKVLIVDDDLVIQQALEMALEKEGYDLYFAENGQKGLEIFNRENPELIFLDLRMPVMDGFSFLESIDIEPDSAYTVIVITGHGMDYEIERCYELGIDFFLKKPLSVVEICGLARRCMQVKRLRAEKENLIRDLQQADETIRQLKSFLVLCSSCKKVRDKNDQWHNLDAYITAHTDTKITHGICQECAKKLYPELYDRVHEKLKKKKIK